MTGKSHNLQRLVRDPPPVALQRLHVYSTQVAGLLDHANSNESCAAARRACELAAEFLATGIAKAGRV